MLWLREAYSPKFNFEQFPGISNIPNWHINNGQPLWLSIFNLDHCGRPRWTFILAIVWNYIIFELSTMPNFQIVPWLKGNCFSMMFSSGMIVGYRIWAMISHILTCFGGHHLQETNLVGIGFVGEGKSTVGRDVWKPSFSLFSHVRYLQKELIFMKLSKDRIVQWGHMHPEAAFEFRFVNNFGREEIILFLFYFILKNSE